LFELFYLLILWKSRARKYFFISATSWKFANMMSQIKISNLSSSLIKCHKKFLFHVWQLSVLLYSHHYFGILNSVLDMKRTSRVFDCLIKRSLDLVRSPSTYTDMIETTNMFVVNEILIVSQAKASLFWKTISFSISHSSRHQKWNFFWMSHPCPQRLRQSLFLTYCFRSYNISLDLKLFEHLVFKKNHQEEGRKKEI